MHRLRIDDIARHMELRQGATVADVGCGSGEIAVALSRGVGPSGRVYAEDIRKNAVSETKRTAKKHKARNVIAVLGDAKDPKLPAGTLDAILLLDVYHELEKYPNMLERMRASLKPGGRLVIVDPVPRKTGPRGREVQMKNHVLLPEIAATDLTDHGFSIVHRDDKFLDHPDDEGIQWLIVASPAR
jgi:ubiquinone/menaquinone biosynthesis C-methylase UbiE